MKRLVIAALIVGAAAALVAQAPVVRRPPAMDGPQAPSNDDHDVPAAQAPVAKEGTIWVQARLVNVVVKVVDAAGAPVGGLGRYDFEVLEDGKPFMISGRPGSATII